MKFSTFSKLRNVKQLKNNQQDNIYAHKDEERLIFTLLGNKDAVTYKETIHKQ